MHDRKDGAMTATDELRRLLDERGVEWCEPVQMEGSIFTRWNIDGVSWTASMVHGRNNALRIGASVVTPEQAIAATLGTPERTCHIEERYIDWYCDACFEMVGTCDTTSELFIDGNAIKLWNYCPYCGARVERREQ